MRIGILGCGRLGLHLARSLKEDRFAHLPTPSTIKIAATTTSEDNLETIQRFSDSQEVLLGSQKSKLQAFLYPLEYLVVAVNAKSPCDYHKTYLLTCRNLKNILSSPKALGPDHIIFCSSTGIYGDQEGKVVDESAELLSKTPKNLAIIEAEKELLKLSQKVKVTILRLSQLYGPSHSLEFQIELLSGSTLCGKGDYYTNFTHFDDASAAIMHIFQSELTGIYNCAGKTHMLRHHFYNIVCGRFGWPAPTWDGSQGFIPYRQNKIVSSDKLMQTGYTFGHPQVFEWLKDS